MLRQSLINVTTPPTARTLETCAYNLTFSSSNVFFIFFEVLNLSFTSNAHVHEIKSKSSTSRYIHNNVEIKKKKCEIVVKVSLFINRNKID